MSAINVFPNRDVVHIATDGQVYNNFGDGFAAMQKVAILGHLPAVITARGSCTLIEMAGSRASLEFKSFDVLVERIGDFCKAVHLSCLAYMEAIGAPVHYPRSEFVIAGWSERRGRLETYYVPSHSSNDVEAWEYRIHLEDEYLTSPDDGTIDLAAMEDSIGNLSMNPVSAAVILVEKQRALKLKDFKDPPVGAFIQLTSISRDGISTRIVRRWPAEAVA